MRWVLVAVIALGLDPTEAARATTRAGVDSAVGSAGNSPFHSPVDSPVDRAFSLTALSIKAPPEPPVALADADTLPVVTDWLPEAHRCERRGRRRFCNGPRRVAAPAGKASLVASTLGLGSHRAAAELIRGTPWPQWLAATAAMGLEPPQQLHWPVDGGRFGRGFGRGRAAGGPRHHRGVDVTAEVGTPVRVVADGIVAYADNTVSGYGNLLVVLHGGGRVSTYAHLTAIHVPLGARLSGGQVVAQAGTTGVSRGPHLHFEWREKGRPIDPMERFAHQHWPRWRLRARGLLQ